MDIKIRISRTWQQNSYEPITVEAEITVHDVQDYEAEYAEIHSKLETSIAESEVKLRDLYTPEKTDRPKPTRNTRVPKKEFDAPVENTRDYSPPVDRKPKRRMGTTRTPRK